MYQIMAIVFNLITLNYYVIRSYSSHQIAFKPNAEISMISKLLLTTHLLCHLIAWITIRLCLNQFTYLSIAMSILICFSAIKLGNCKKNRRQIWTEVHSSRRPDNFIMNTLVTSWITPVNFVTEMSSKVFIQKSSALQRKIAMTFTSMATTLLQLVHLSAIALMLHLTDIFGVTDEIRLTMKFCNTILLLVYLFITEVSSSWNWFYPHLPLLFFGKI